MEEEGDAAVVGVGASADVNGGVIVSGGGDGGVMQQADDAAAGPGTTMAGSEPI